MKILRLTWRPADYIRDRYFRDTTLASLPYGNQLARLFADFWGTADGWSHALRQLGHDASDHIVGVPQLIEAWHRETGNACSNAGGFAADLIRHERPDVLVLEGVERFTLGQVNAYRENLGPAGLLAGVSGFEVDTDGPIRGLDVFFTCRPDLAQSLAREGLNARHLAHAFDPRILEAMGSEGPQAMPFGFIGSIIPGSRMHDARRQVIERLAKRFNFPIYSPSERSMTIAALRYVARAAARTAGKTIAAIGAPMPDHPIARKLRTAAAWPELPRFEYIPGISDRMRPPVYGLEMYRVMRSFTSTVNIQPGLSNKHATNVRLFEATGVGSCLLTDRSVDIGDYFTDDEIVTFTSIDEAVERAAYLIENPSRAAEIGRRGQQRTLASHTHLNRMTEVCAALVEARALRSRASGIAVRAAS